MNIEYFLIFCLNNSNIFIVIFLFFLFYILIYREIDFEKLSAYECGFNPFEDAYGRFDIRFYLVAILFLIFDLEVIFLYPWCLSASILGSYIIWIIFSFLLILILGFLYEWKRGALDWQ